MKPTASRYLGATAMLATMHGKESVIAPVFLESLGLRVEVANVDTDQFGTFSGETPRRLPQVESAIAKARAAIEQTGAPLAIASEGTIGSHPVVPFVISDYETVVFVDSELDVVIHESYRSSDILNQRLELSPGDDIRKFLVKADFPNHGLIVRNQEPGSEQVVKGIRDIATLEQVISKLAGSSGKVTVETDLRASHCPSRMLNIAHCAKLLAQRISRECPSCSAPGWGNVEPIFGLPCVYCTTLVTTVVKSDQLGCFLCSYRE
ncbi:MAG: hypothetical protein F2609_04685, partial [Actinobacteria bacterium]|nr:hypothetical protein [Actinomycetota bacterium]